MGFLERGEGEGVGGRREVGWEALRLRWERRRGDDGAAVMEPVGRRFRGGGVEVGLKAYC